MTKSAKDAIEIYSRVLGKSAKGKIAGKELIRKAIDDPNTYVFGELLGIGCMEATKGEKEYQMLLLFAYGTYMDYKEHPDKFPVLSDKNKKKLKQLSVVSMAQKDRVLPYKMLMKKLEISKTRELEDMLIDSMYTNLLTGKLDQKLESFEVASTMTRDVKKEDIGKMIDNLGKWVKHSNKVLEVIKKMEIQAKDEFKLNEIKEESINKEIEGIEKTLKAAKSMDQVDVPRQRRKMHRQ